jgi:hypothetical protein
MARVTISWAVVREELCFLRTCNGVLPRTEMNAQSVIDDA